MKSLHTEIHEEIQKAIGELDIQKAQELLRQVLKNNPTAESYYLASQVAPNEDLKQNFLEKAIDLDPFHDKAQKALNKTKAPLGKAQVVITSKNYWQQFRDVEINRPLVDEQFIPKPIYIFFLWLLLGIVFLSPIIASVNYSDYTAIQVRIFEYETGQNEPSSSYDPDRMEFVLQRAFVWYILGSIFSLFAYLGTIFYLINFSDRVTNLFDKQNTLKKTSKDLYFLFIPLFNRYWIFHIVPNINHILGKYSKWNKDSVSFIGLVACILFAIPLIRLLAYPLLVLWIILASSQLRHQYKKERQLEEKV